MCNVSNFVIVRNTFNQNYQTNVHFVLHLFTPVERFILRISYIFLNEDSSTYGVENSSQQRYYIMKQVALQIPYKDIVPHNAIAKTQITTIYQAPTL